MHLANLVKPCNKCFQRLTLLSYAERCLWAPPSLQENTWLDFHFFPILRIPEIPTDGSHLPSGQWSCFPFTSEYVAFLLPLVVFIWLQPHETAVEYYFLNECKPSYFPSNSLCAPCLPCSLILGRMLSAPWRALPSLSWASDSEVCFIK